MAVDPKFTKKIQDWLYTETKTDGMAISGAALLAQINPRNLVYRRWLSLAAVRPKTILPKIEYELKKHLKYRLDGLTLEEVRRLDQNVVPEANKILTEGAPAETAAAPTPEKAAASTEAEATEEVKQETVKTLGKRPDHEQLPDKIKKLWDDNGELYKEIKATFEELKSMENLPSCDRYDKLQLLQSLDTKYLKQMEQYDNYEIGSEQPEETAEAAKNVGTARSYLSKNLKKLTELKSASEAEAATDEDKKSYETLLAKMQQRLDVLLEAKAPITDELKASYESLGLKVNGNENSDNPEGTEAAQ
jgi:hypothetical protein